MLRPNRHKVPGHQQDEGDSRVLAGELTQPKFSIKFRLQKPETGLHCHAADHHHLTL